MRDKYCKCHHPEHYHYLSIAKERLCCVRTDCDCEKFSPTSGVYWILARIHHWIEDALKALI